MSKRNSLTQEYALAKELGFQATSKNARVKNPYMLLGITQLTSENTATYTGISGMAPAQVSSQIAALNNKITSNSKTLNAELDKQLNSLGLK
jgi:hypothetical protein